MYDYGARFYDPALARFTTIDPWAELFNNQSPFLYAYNNPVRYTDFLGLGARDNVENEDEKKKKEEQKKKEEKKEEPKKEEPKKQEPKKEEKKENVWEQYGMTKEEWEKLSPEHQSWIMGANEFSETLNEAGDTESQLKKNEVILDWWSGYSEGAMDVAQQSLTDSDIGRGGRSFGYTVVSVMTQDSVKKYQRKVDSLSTVKDSLINQMNKLLKK